MPSEPPRKSYSCPHTQKRIPPPLCLYVDLLNSIITEGSIKMKHTSERIKERVRLECWRANNEIIETPPERSKRKTTPRANKLPGYFHVLVLIN